jgi:hypothetical protein
LQAAATRISTLAFPGYDDRRRVWEPIMRILAILSAALVLAAGANAAFAGEKIRLAQSSTTTNCMMTCNSQAAACFASCIVPGTPPAASATAAGNATASTPCVINCSTQQVSCHTTCARVSPSQ